MFVRRSCVVVVVVMVVNVGLLVQVVVGALSESDWPTRSRSWHRCFHSPFAPLSRCDWPDSASIRSSLLSCCRFCLKCCRSYSSCSSVSDAFFAQRERINLAGGLNGLPGLKVLNSAQQVDVAGRILFDDIFHVVRSKSFAKLASGDKIFDLPERSDHILVLFGQHCEFHLLVCVLLYVRPSIQAGICVVVDIQSGDCVGCWLC